MKQCKSCLKFSNYNNFYNSLRAKDGKQSYCKKCIKEKIKKTANKQGRSKYYKEYYKKNKEKIKEYHQKYYKENKFIYLERDKKNKQKEKYKKWKREYDKKYRIKNKNKVEARDKIRKLVKSGKIERIPCQICKNVKTEFHHPNYNYPFLVIHLCDACHKKAHKDKKILSGLKIFNYFNETI